MNKEQLFHEILMKMGTGEITREELQARFGFMPQTSPSQGIPIPNYNNSQNVPEEKKHYSLNKVLYLIGAAIVVIGVITFVAQIWDNMGSFGHIAITLGLGLAFALVGSIFMTSKPADKIGEVFHGIGGVMVPGGAMVMLNEFQITGSWPYTMSFAFLTIMYSLLTFVHRNVVLTLFSIAFGTTFIYTFVNSMLGNNNTLTYIADVYAYLTMVMGAFYVLLGYQFKNTWNSRLTESLYSLGTIAILGSAYSRVFDSSIWQLMYFFIVFGGVFLSIYIKNRNVLILSTLFLVAHISFITSKYFANSLGWPVSLIMLGMIFIGLGYLSINLNKKYISNQS